MEFLARMQQFEYYFGICLGKHLLGITDNLSKALQNPKLCASDAKLMANDVIKTFESLRTEDEFLRLWNEILQDIETKKVNAPELPRQGIIKHWKIFF